MARRVETYVRLIDDLDGTVLPLGEGETIKYGMEGIEYEIDLKPEHAEQFRTMMAPIVAASSRTGGRKIAQRKTAKAVTSSSPKEITAGDRKDTTDQLPYAERMRRRRKMAEVRDWAIERGMRQGKTGRIRDEVRVAWDETHPDDPCPPEVSELDAS